MDTNNACLRSLYAFPIKDNSHMIEARDARLS